MNVVASPLASIRFELLAAHLNKNHVRRTRSEQSKILVESGTRQVDSLSTESVKLVFTAMIAILTQRNDFYMNFETLEGLSLESEYHSIIEKEVRLTRQTFAEKSGQPMKCLALRGIWRKPVSHIGIERLPSP